VTFAAPATDALDFLREHLEPTWNQNPLNAAIASSPGVLFKIVIVGITF